MKSVTIKIPPALVKLNERRVERRKALKSTFRDIAKRDVELLRSLTESDAGGVEAPSTMLKDLRGEDED